MRNAPQAPQLIGPKLGTEYSAVYVPAEFKTDTYERRGYGLGVQGHMEVNEDVRWVSGHGMQELLTKYNFVTVPPLSPFPKLSRLQCPYTHLPQAIPALPTER